jgi:hypothetical protein
MNCSVIEEIEFFFTQVHKPAIKCICDVLCKQNNVIRIMSFCDNHKWSNYSSTHISEEAVLLLSEVLMNRACKLQDLRLVLEPDWTPSTINKLITAVKKSSIRTIDQGGADPEPISEAFPENDFEHLSKLLTTRWYRVTVYLIAIASIPRFRKASLATRLMSADMVQKLMTSHLQLQYETRRVWSEWSGIEPLPEQYVLIEKGIL